MKIPQKRKAFYITCITVPSILMAGIFLSTSNHFPTFVKANNEHTFVLNKSNSPILSEGEGTMVDSKGVTWEYHNASDYNNGHVSLNHQGYFGVSASSQYGFTGISELTVTFGTNSTGELWLLNSIDGLNWGDVEMLKSPSESSKTSATSTLIEGWRYIRLYYYDTGAASINIDALSLTYSCVGVSQTEDVDGARAINVITTGGATSSNITYTDEYEDVSPLSIGGEAVSFAKTDTKSSTICIGFGKTYTNSQILWSKVEFDMKTANFNYGKSIELSKNGSRIGSTIWSNSSTSYKYTSLGDSWYHIEVAVPAFFTNISGYDGNDKPQSDILKKEVNAIKINAGACIIDNLRITSTESELGNYNNTASYPPKANTVSWVKFSWVGILYPELVEITFDDPTAAERIPFSDPKLTNGSPFYIRWLKTGNITVTCTIVSGYNRQSHTMAKTFSVTAS